MSEYFKKYIKYKKKYILAKQLGGTTIDEDILTFDNLSNMISEVEKKTLKSKIRILQQIKGAEDIDSLTRICEGNADLDIIRHCNKKANNFLENTIMRSDEMTLDTAIQLFNSIQFRSEILEIPLKRLVELRDRNYEDERNIGILMQTQDSERRPIVQKFIQKKIKELFPESIAKEDGNGESKQNNSGESKQNNSGESKQNNSGESKEADTEEYVIFNEIDPLVSKIIELSMYLGDKQRQCSIKLFDNPDEIERKIRIAADTKTGPIVKPFGDDMRAYNNDEDYQNIKGRGYHTFGIAPNDERLDFYFRHFLFSGSMYYIISELKGVEFDWRRREGVRKYFINDTIYSQFFNYIMGRNELCGIIKEIAMIYQHLKIYEERKLKNYKNIPMVLNVINNIVVSMLFLICKTLNNKDLFKIPGIDGNFDVNSEYNKDINLSELIRDSDPGCISLFNLEIRKYFELKEYLKQLYNFLNIRSPI